MLFKGLNVLQKQFNALRETLFYLELNKNVINKPILSAVNEFLYQYWLAKEL